MQTNRLVWLALAALTALGFVYFPGHTYLQSDTQIYVPILERLNDRSLFQDEIIAQRPHVSFTMYDEAALWLRHLTGWGFRDVLALQQIVFRFAALAGVYWMAASLGVSAPGAILVAAAFGLGATVMGPSVLTFEYEPVPRGNAIGLTMLAIGLVARGKHLWAGCAAALAFLYHVPAVYPYWAAYFVLALIPRKPEEMRGHIRGLLPMAGGVLLLLVLSQLQVGEGEQQKFFTRIDPEHESMMRERASYNWVSLWNPRIYVHYAVLFTVCMAALYRLRQRMSADFRVMAAVTSLVGMLSMPVSYVLLERMKWSLMPQIQPMRAVLYVTAMAVILSAGAAVVSAEERRWREVPVWLCLALLPPAATTTFHYLWERRFLEAPLAVLAAAAICTLGLWAATQWKRAGLAAVAAACALTFVIPAVSKVRNYPPLHHVELDDLARWARGNTRKSAVFLFPDAGKDLRPGVFRAEALRTVYVDWKGGGQINFLRDFLTIWLPRWQTLIAPGFERENLERYKPFGIHYVVVLRSNSVAGGKIAYENAKYVVYAL
ncbi:MAG: hypothetical protein JNK48_26660 [Bryobacterales bacterium]|nr:hypothetical protein [Bryobacterales bacterium]